MKNTQNNNKIFLANLISAVCLTLASTAVSAAASQDLLLYVNDKPASSFSEAEGSLTTEIELAKGKYSLLISDKNKSCNSSFGDKSKTEVLFSTPTKLDLCTSTGITLNIPFKGKYLVSFDPKAATVSVTRKTKAVTYVRSAPEGPCESWKKGTAITVDVSKIWANGTKIKDSYSGKLSTVNNGKITMTPDASSNGLLLLEKVEAKPSNKFSWDNASIYFLLTDRFENGDKTNDHAFGRHNDYPEEINIGTWHGGDFQGINAKLDYLQKLGVNAIWISPIVEQIHGFVGQGPKGEFPIYPYHGYWAADFTQIDPNLGSEEDFKKLVDAAHKRGIRVVVDIVMNHIGYLNLGDMQDMGYPEMANIPNLPKEWNDWLPEDGNFDIFQPSIRVTDKGWDKWWTPQWIRLTHIPSYEPCDD